jgi:5,10-methylenetetrahydromethanopterin reductase
MPDQAPLRIGVAIGGTEPLPDTIALAGRLDEGDAVDHLWVADERFRRDVWASLGALAATTKRLRLATCVTDPFIRHPALTGAAIATVDDQAPGRTILGLGAGLSGFEVLGVRRDAPATALREMIAFLRRFWMSDAPFEFVGSTLRFQGGRMGFRPPQPIPIYVAARGPKILELAGEAADGVLVATFVDGPLLDASLARVAAGEANRGPLKPLERVSWAYVSIDDDRQAARAAVREGIAVALWGSRDILASLGITLPKALVNVMERRAYSIEHETIAEAARLVPDDLVDQCSIAGPPAEVATSLLRLRGRGFGHVACWLFPPAGQSQQGQVDRLTTDVIPLLRQLEGVAVPPA